MTSPQAIADAVGKLAAERDMAARKLGITLLSMAPGGCRLRLTVQPDMVNSHGTSHVGVIFTPADSAFGYACNSFNRHTVAQPYAISFLRPVALGTVPTVVRRAPV